jgi:hypothetical protein
MTWRPALLGAVVVIAIGFVVGIATGGGETRTATVTVTGPGSSSGRHTSTGGTSNPAPAPVQYLASDSQPHSYNLDVVADAPAQVRIGRDRFENSIELQNIFLIDCDENATVEYLVDSATAAFSGTLGWTDSDSWASVQLELRANTADGRLLYRHQFDGPVPQKVHVPLHGATTAVFVFLVPSDCDNADDLTLDQTFALGNARFVG